MVDVCGGLLAAETSRSGYQPAKTTGTRARRPLQAWRARRSFPETTSLGQGRFLLKAWLSLASAKTRCCYFLEPLPNSYGRFYLPPARLIKIQLVLHAGWWYGSEWYGRCLLRIGYVKCELIFLVPNPTVSALLLGCMVGYGRGL